MNLNWVAPFAGAWIEIYEKVSIYRWYHVAPFAGAWIEIVKPSFFKIPPMSLPSRERGLKFINKSLNKIFVCRSLRGSVDWNIRSLWYSGMICVAPFAGAWIEIIELEKVRIACKSRSLRGSVDWNTQELLHYRSGRESLPSRERGLKFNDTYQPPAQPKSLPSRERGLK